MCSLTLLFLCGSKCSKSGVMHDSNVVVLPLLETGCQRTGLSDKRKHSKGQLNYLCSSFCKAKECK